MCVWTRSAAAEAAANGGTPLTLRNTNTHTHTHMTHSPNPKLVWQLSKEGKGEKKKREKLINLSNREFFVIIKNLKKL